MFTSGFSKVASTRFTRELAKRYPVSSERYKILAENFKHLHKPHHPTFPHSKRISAEISRLNEAMSHAGYIEQAQMIDALSHPPSARLVPPHLDNGDSKYIPKVKKSIKEGIMKYKFWLQDRIKTKAPMESKKWRTQFEHKFYTGKAGPAIDMKIKK